MSEEEKKAIEIFQKYIDFCKNNKECREELKNCFGCTVEVEEINAMQTLLNLIQKQEKVIDEMALQLAGLAIWNNEKDEPLILGNDEEVKQYFYRKVEEDG